MENEKNTSPLGRDALDYIDSFLTAEEIEESDLRVSRLRRASDDIAEQLEKIVENAKRSY